MFKKKPTVEWVFLAEEEQDGTWPPEPQELSGHTVPGTHQRFRRAILFSVTIAILLVAGIGVAYTRHEALQGVHALEQDVQAAVEVEAWTQHHAPELLAYAMVDEADSRYWMQTFKKERRVLAPESGGTAPTPTPDIQDIWFAEGMAAARLTLVQPALDDSAALLYRQTRFYRETENGWLRTKPYPGLWGAPLRLETARLVWRYRQRDHAVVAEIAGQMDALYAKLQWDYGLTQAPENQNLVVDVRVDYAPWRLLSDILPGRAAVGASQSLTLASPAIYLVPSHLADTDILSQAIALALLKAVWDQATVQHGLAIQEAPSVLYGLRLWQIWEMGPSLHKWRGDVLQWAYGNVTSDTEGSATILPARYHELCAAHRSWMITPSTTGIPLYCDVRDGPSARHRILLDDLTSLGNLKEMPQYESEESDFRLLAKYLTMSTVIDYVVVTYGRERLPVLVAALGHHDSWETLVPVVYGVSLHEFEQGWQQHVADRLAGTQYHLAK